MLLMTVSPVASSTSTGRTMSQTQLSSCLEIRSGGERWAKRVADVSTRGSVSTVWCRIWTASMDNSSLTMRKVDVKCHE